MATASPAAAQVQLVEAEYVSYDAVCHAQVVRLQAERREIIEARIAETKAPVWLGTFFPTHLSGEGC